MIKHESPIDFLQMCLLCVPLLNMDPAQLPPQLCHGIDTLSIKAYSFFNKALRQRRKGLTQPKAPAFDLL